MKRRALISVLVLTAAMVAWSVVRDARREAPVSAGRRAAVNSTTRADLDRTVAAMEARLREQPTDGAAVVQLADALIRQQRVNSDASAAVRAEEQLRSFLARVPGHYEAQRMLGNALLSQHRFRDAIREAERARAADPRDEWNYGVLGDAHLELGDYEAAFAAFDRMGQLRPGPAAYARVAYALELKGDLTGALESMRMAADGTSAHDAEGQAWHYAQLGNLLLQLGRIGDARREFERAAFTFPDHPYATQGLARVKIAEQDFAGALSIFERMLAQTPTPELAWAVGDLHARLGRPDQADALYARAEGLEREGWASEEPQPQALARMLAERDRAVPEAVRLAEEAASRRRDINTMDAVAWASFKAGKLAAAQKAADAATRTGTRDARILYHAAAIRFAAGDSAGAAALLNRIPAPAIETDVISSPQAALLRARLQSASR